MSFSWLRIGTQNLLSCIHSHCLPLSPKANLKWIGFTDEGSLATSDSFGILRIFYDKIWRPLCALDEQVRVIYLLYT